MALPLDFYGIQLKIVIFPYKDNINTFVTGNLDSALDEQARRARGGDETRKLLIDFIYKTVSNINIEIGLGTNFKIIVDLEPTFEEMLEFIKIKDLIRLINVLGVRIGYLEYLSPWYYGIMSEYPDITIGADNSISLKAIGAGLVLDRSVVLPDSQLERLLSGVVVSRKDFKDVSAYKVSIKEVIDYIAKAVGMKVEYDDGPRMRDILNKKQEYLGITADMTYISILDTICNKVGLNYSISGNTLYITTDKDIKKSKVIFALYQPIDLSTRPPVIPMLDFNVETTTLFLGTLNQNDIITLLGVDPDTKKEVNEQVPALKIPAGVKGESKQQEHIKFLTDRIKDSLIYGYKDNFTSRLTEDELKRRQEMARNVIQQNKYFNIVNFSTLGIVNIAPGDRCDIRGLGVFDGQYLITNMIHQIGSDGFITKFDAISAVDIKDNVPATEQTQRGETTREVLPVRIE